MTKKSFDFKLSPFAHIISLPDSHYEILYNALNLRLVVVRKDIVQALKQSIYLIDPTTLYRLCSTEILIPVRKTGFESLERAREFFQRRILGVLCLMLTESCNLRCHYCFIEHKFPVNYTFNSLTPQRAKQGIDVFINHLPESLENGLENPTISFYGGEPLLNYPTFRLAVEYISQLRERGQIPLHTLLTINTNGTVVTPKIAHFLKEYNIAVAVSLDGPQSVHDLARKDISGEGSFQKTLEGIKTLREYGIGVSISCAVAMHNLERLEEITEWFFDQLEVDVIGFNILLEGGLPEPNFELGNYSIKLGEKLVRCFQITRSRGKQEERSFRLARSFAERKIHYYDCSACGQQLVVDPQGRFGPCHAYIHSEKNFILPDPSIDLFSHPLWQEWRQRSPLNMEQCQNCIALGICGGGCPYNAESRKGSIWELDEAFCSFARSLITLLIREVAEKAISSYN